MEIKDLIFRYGAVVSRRFYKREKLRFLNGLAKEFQNQGMKLDLKETVKNQHKAYNLYVGDITKTGLIISTYYDTPPKTFNIFKHQAYSPKSDRKAFILSILIPFLAIVTIGALYVKYVLNGIWSTNLFSFINLLGIVPLLILLFFLSHYRNGIGNRVNFIRNSASIIGCIKLVQSLKPRDKNRIGIAFTDYGCINHYGDDMLRSLMRNNADLNTIISLDCIGSDEDTIILYTKTCNEYIEKVKKNVSQDIIFYEIDEKDTHYYCLFKNTIVLTSGKIKDGIVTVDKVNTSKDNNIDEEKLALAINLLKELVLQY